LNTVTSKNISASAEANQNDYQGGPAEAIQKHYDAGNDFYRLWLDKSLTYSGALWKADEASDDLESAQLRKLRYHIIHARAAGAKRVLDIGCGCASLLRRMVEHHGVHKAVGLTLSKHQVEWGRLLGDPRIEFRLENWYDHAPEEPYDSIISMGAFEHFAKRGLSEPEKVEAFRDYFQCCHKWLKPGRWMTLQTIGQLNMRPEDLNECVVTEVLPEGNLPTLAEIAKAYERLFEIVTLQDDRRHYELTCRAWLSRLRANRPEAVKLVGEEVVARYEKWLRFCIIQFHIGTTGLLRITLQRIDNPRK